MADKRNFFRLRSLPAGRMLAVLAELDAHLPLLAESGACLSLEHLGTARLHLPHPEHAPAASRQSLSTAIDAVSEAMRSVGDVNFDHRATGSAPLPEGRYLPLAFAATALLTLDAHHADYADPADPDAQTLALISATKDQMVLAARAVSDLARMTRDVRLIGGQNEDGPAFALLFDHTPSRGARLEALQASGRLASVELFSGYESPGGPLYLQEGLRPGLDQIQRAGRIALALQGTEIVHAARIDPDAGHVDVHAVARPRLDVLAALADGDPANGALSIAVHSLAKNEDAIAQLQRAVVSHDFPIGYKISLSRLPEWAFRGEDLGSLQAQIDALEARITMLDGLGARQMTLLRFTPAQLGAMVDALRRLPRDRLGADDIRYGYSHRPRPEDCAHFLLCDPDAASGLLQFSEELWRARTQDREMIFWVDPVWARQLEEDDNLSGLVFVPRHTTLTPSLSTFGSDLEGTLTAVMGDLFLHAKRPEGGEPLYLFAPGTSPGKIDVEILDLREFGPIELRLKWINDHLQLGAPQPVDQKLVAQVAADLYEGWAAGRIREETAARTAEMSAAYDVLNTDLLSGIESLAEAVAAEVDATTVRLKEAFGFLEHAAMRLNAIEAVVVDTADLLETKEDAVRDLSALPDDLAAVREDVRRRLLSEFQRVESLTEAAEGRMERHRERLERLRDSAGRLF